MAHELHVVFGTGQVGAALCRRLAVLGLPVRALSRSRPPALPIGIPWAPVDATDAESAIAAASGATVVYQCLNAPYTDWPRSFPPLQRAVIAAAERSDARYVSFENVYAYGPTHGVPMVEDLPLAASTSKGRARAQMTAELLAEAEAGRLQVTIGRASDFFGPGATETTLGARVFGNAVARHRAQFLGNPDLPHTYSYVPDIAAGLATIGTDDRSIGRAWHLPGPETLTTRAIVEIAARHLGHPVALRSVPSWLVRSFGWAHPMARALGEMSYEFDEPFVLDTSSFSTTFGTVGTPMEDAVAATVDWYREAHALR